MKSVGLFGAKGFVGSELHEVLKDKYAVTAITRDTFDSNMGKSFDYIVNAAMPAARFKAKNDPAWDFRESVEKTAKILYGMKYQKFIQISSISARCQLDTIYGRHKLAAENLVNDGKNLVIRLGPMFGPTLSKGVLIDMLGGKNVFVAGTSRYAFCPVGFVGRWIASNLERTGVVEVGAKNSIALAELAKQLNLNVTFEGSEDHQEITAAAKEYPDVSLVLEYMKDRKRKAT